MPPVPSSMKAVVPLSTRPSGVVRCPRATTAEPSGRARICVRSSELTGVGVGAAVAANVGIGVAVGWGVGANVGVGSGIGDVEGMAVTKGEPVGGGFVAVASGL